MPWYLKSVGMQGGYVGWLIGLYVLVTGAELSPADIGLLKQCIGSPKLGGLIMAVSAVQLYGRWRVGPRQVEGR